MVDHMTRSKVSLHEHNGIIESIMIRRTRKHNNMILRAYDHGIIFQFLSIMCQGLVDLANTEVTANQHLMLRIWLVNG